MTKNYDKKEIETARKFFAGPCDFTWGAAEIAQLPDYSRPEIAFCGRSNVGKSSLLNALTGRRSLARTSDTPGRTQQLNFFDLGGRANLVDMPGYGYAKVSKAEKAIWEGLIRDYLRGRPNLRCVLVLIDSRHGIKPVDEEILKLIDESAVSCRIVLTKADKAEDLLSVKAEIEKALKKHPAAFPEALVTSARETQGIDILRAMLYGLLF